ncbi:chemotaxis protein CheX [Oceanobacillus sp. 143]|jgi:chemotaxis protein CheX|uniref:Chemotaxis protein CheX n=1 Tax=Oceanobacillus zhaokaii TaxID=2052660 RepID=A0A345PJ67_9BACI|nr:chemotaxis protein CheX [Oceanobacillus zhaokaii]AXI10047.1 chemotaxis protein CheX [Oceanobacillus zhaokaii]QGS69192.1 chemotaxis protein CheX [Oceanobacillus sp. 143]
MTISVKERNRNVTSLLNGMQHSLQSIIPLNHQLSKPSLLEHTLQLTLGVLIGITGDIRGKLIFSGNQAVFGSIAESMYGMAIDGEMLTSFSGELGNMIAGNLATNIVQYDLRVDITAPTIIEGNTILSGYDKAIQLSAHFGHSEDLEIYLIID